MANPQSLVSLTYTLNGNTSTTSIPKPTPGTNGPLAEIQFTINLTSTTIYSNVPNPELASSNSSNTAARSSTQSSAVQSSSATQAVTTTASSAQPGVLSPESTASSVHSAGPSTTLTLHTSFNATSTGVQSVDYVAVIPVPTKKIGVAPGITAGVAIATLIIGALVATAIMLVMQKKKKRRSRSSKVAPLSAYASNAGDSHSSQGPPAVPVKEKAVVTTETTDPDYLLPQPKDDQSMATAAKQFFIHIDNHVENFYHNESLRSANTPTSDEDNLLVSRKTRFFALKQVICREMLDAISWECIPENSLFSPTAVATAKSMSRGNLGEATYEVAWSRWRVSTALLLKSEDASLRTQAREYWLDRLQRRLEPFQLNTPGIHPQIREDLYAICKLAENLATLVYSQPARWEFNWPKRSQLVIFPEFVRTTDNSARRLDRPRRVVDAQVMQ